MAPKLMAQGINFGIAAAVQPLYRATLVKVALKNHPGAFIAPRPARARGSLGTSLSSA